jgi:hypothetical protein
MHFLFPPIGPFTTIDIMICDSYWMDGYPVGHMADRISQVLGRDRRRVVEALGQYPVRCRVDIRLIACEL